MKKKHEDGPDIKGGQIDALIVHATKVQKFSEGLCLFLNVNYKFYKRT